MTFDRMTFDRMTFDRMTFDRMTFDIISSVLNSYGFPTLRILAISLVKISYLIFSFFNDSRLLAPKYSEYFTGSAPPILYFLIRFSIGCSTPFYSRSGSLIGSAYLFLYISFRFGINKTLTNLTLLRQHHLQYKYSLC
jgi:hypothetical protein